jgi:hypothetical protein
MKMTVRTTTDQLIRALRVALLDAGDELKDRKPPEQSKAGERDHERD